MDSSRAAVLARRDEIGDPSIHLGGAVADEAEAEAEAGSVGAAFLDASLPRPLLATSFSAPPFSLSGNRKIHPPLRSWVTAALSNTANRSANPPKKKASFREPPPVVGLSLSEFGGGGRRSDGSRWCS